LLPQSGHKISRNEEFSGKKSDISNCILNYSHGWAHVSEEEMQAKRINTGSKKPTASRAVQCRMLGFSTPYEVTDSTGSTVWVKNAFTCYNLESKNIMCRHDCFWNCSTPGALSDVITNTPNDTDLLTTSEEEFDYTLIGMDTQPRTTPSEWTDNGRDPTQILREIGDPIPIEDKSHENHVENHSDPSEDAISEVSDYEKQKAKRARKARPPRSHSPEQFNT
jgi:hypothetical protein